MRISIVWLLIAVAGCGGRERDGDLSATDAGARPDALVPEDDGGSGLDGGPPSDRDGGPPSDLDGGTLSVSCSLGSGPVLVVTRGVAGTTRDETLLRIPLQFSGAASGIEIMSVEQRDGDDAVVRTWPVGELAPPAGFDGRAVARYDAPSPTVLFTATADAHDHEQTLCDGELVDRESAGSVSIDGSTNEGGVFHVECRLGLDFGGRGMERLPFRCARGVAGWLETNSTRVFQATTPIVAALVEARPTIHALGPMLDDFASTEAVIFASSADDFGFPACRGPVEWRTITDRQILWRGTSSADVWSGPVAPGTEESVNWFSQTNESLPDGICAVPDMGAPTCHQPSTRAILRGTSSAGTWEWESDLFTCYDTW